VADLWLGPFIFRRPPEQTRVQSEIELSGDAMYHYDPKIALEELQEDALLPHPVKLRDMIMRIQLQPKEAQSMNQEFQDYLTRFGEIQAVARTILQKLATGNPKSA
jgi:hypothetical protein